MQQKRDEESRAKDKKKEKAAPPRERRTIGVIPPDVKNAKIVNEEPIEAYKQVRKLLSRMITRRAEIKAVEEIRHIELVWHKHEQTNP